MSIKKIIYIIIGSIALALGCLGVAFPLLPAFPFLLLATCCFGKSSSRLDTWFHGTNLYKNNLESYVKGQGMTKKVKIKIMLMVTFLMTFGFFMMNGIFWGQFTLFIVWLFHIFYFSFKIKTIPPHV